MTFDPRDPGAFDPRSPGQAGSLAALIAAIQNNGLLFSEIYQAITALTAAIVAGAAVQPTYATGTWTPQLLFGGAHVGMTTSAASGTYTKIGREIIARFHIVLTAVGASTGAVTISGLPFAASADATEKGAGGAIPVYANLATLTGVPVLTVAASASVIQALSSGAAASAALADTNFTATSEINGYVSYFS